MLGTKIPDIEDFNNIDRDTVFGVNRNIACVQNKFEIKNLIITLSNSFAWLDSYYAELSITAGAGGILLRASHDEALRCSQNNEKFYEELEQLDMNVYKSGISAKLTTLLSIDERELYNKTVANGIIIVRNSYYRIMISIRDSKSLEINEKSEEQILEEMSVNPAFNVLIYPVVKELKCEKEQGWKVMKDILKIQ